MRLLSATVLISLVLLATANFLLVGFAVGGGGGGGPPSLQSLVTGVGSGLGSVTPSCPSPGGCQQRVRSQVSVTATPSPNWSFSGWSITGASCLGGATSNPCVFTMPNNQVTIYASFTKTPRFDFSISSIGEVAVVQGRSGSTMVTVTLTDGQAQTVSLSCPSGLPSGVWCSFGPESGNPTFNSTLTVHTSFATPTGSYTVTVAGTSVGVFRETSFALKVNAPPQVFRFELSSKPSGQSIPQNSSTSYSLSVFLRSGPPQVVSLTVWGCPNQTCTCRFNPPSGSPPFNSTLTVIASPSAVAGTYTLTITGSGGGETDTTRVYLTVYASESSQSAAQLRFDSLALLIVVALGAGVGSFTVGFASGRRRKYEPPPSVSYPPEGLSLLTVPGRRPTNEDSVLVSELNSGSYLGTRRRTLFLIADGVGGREAGQVASLAACRIVAEKLSTEFADTSKPMNHPTLMTGAVLSANAQILNLASSQPQLQGMASTLTAAVLDQKTLYVAHVGNCRAYLIRSGTITQLTRDHTYVQELLDKGQIVPQQAQIHPRRNVITRAVGNKELLIVDTCKVEVGRGDQLLLCTDGLSDYVSPGEALYAIQQARGNLQGACEALADLALRKGSKDNISVIVATLCAPPPRMPYA